jgi:hypothetical protein
LAKPLPLHQQPAQEARASDEGQGWEQGEAEPPPERPGKGKCHPWSVSSDAEPPTMAEPPADRMKADLADRI